MGSASAVVEAALLSAFFGLPDLGGMAVSEVLHCLGGDGGPAPRVERVRNLFLGRLEREASLVSVGGQRKVSGDSGQPPR